MEFKSIGKDDASQWLTDWRNDKNTLRLDDQYAELRKNLMNTYHQLKQKNMKGRVEGGQEQYLIDLEYGLTVFDLLNSNGFTLRMAADDGVWRYLSVAVIPDIVAERWGSDNDDHYWAKPTRNWLRQMWWYVYLSWHGNRQTTLEVLKNNSTDEILNLVERPGKGYNTEVYRHIMYYYSKVPVRKRLDYKKGKGRTLFRTIMVMNTAFTQAIEPGLFTDKEEGYVRWLFENAGVRQR